MNVYRLLSNAAMHRAGAVALRYGKRQATYAELEMAAGCFGAGLLTKGLKPGDRLIVEGQLSVQPGMKVVPKPPQQITAARTATSVSGT